MQKRVQELTRHEWEIAHLVAQGKRRREIAALLFIVPQTVNNHLRNIYEKLGIASPVELAVWVMQQVERTNEKHMGANVFSFSDGSIFLDAYAAYLKQLKEQFPEKELVVNISVDLVPDGVGYAVREAPSIFVEEVTPDGNKKLPLPAPQSGEESLAARTEIEDLGESVESLSAELTPQEVQRAQATAHRVTSSALAKELFTDVSEIIGRLKAHLCGDIVTYLLDDPGVIPEARRVARLAMAYDTQEFIQFLTELQHMAREHGLEATRDSLARWKERVEHLEKKFAEILGGNEDAQTQSS
jgi:DNA-binding CsgD family transcriptional regulator